MKRVLLAAITCIPIFAYADDVAKDIFLQGNQKGAPACQSCHGAEGAGMAAAGIPRLAGLNAEYIEKQLEDFRSGKRSSPIMQPIAELLTVAEIPKIAVYLSELPIPPVMVQTADSALLHKGERIATTGDWSHDIPACFQCHGPNGKGIEPHFPAIAGQHAVYISNQIAAWKSGTRGNDPAGLMKAVADKLSPDQIEEVSTYLANQQLTNGSKK